MWDYVPRVCIIGLFVWMSLSGLHSWVDSMKLVICRRERWGGVYISIILGLDVV